MQDEALESSSEKWGDGGSGNDLCKEERSFVKWGFWARVFRQDGGWVEENSQVQGAELLRCEGRSEERRGSLE